MKLVNVLRDKWSFVLAAATFGISGLIVITTLRQPLLEINDFRQTQTALTSFWMVREGWQFAYQTPVGGSPWSMPFEFPIYQAIVALLVKLSDLPMDGVGRLIGFSFLIACAWPAHNAARSLNLSRDAAWVFCALLWSSPYYLLWSRTFNIETAALFFTLAAISFGLDMRRAEPPLGATCVFAVFGTLAALQKITTAAPALAVVGILLVVDNIQRTRSLRPPLRSIGSWAFAFGLPAAVGVSWIVFTDIIKEQTVLGQALTSKALTAWNFGAVEQRLNFRLLKIVFWDRLVASDLSCILGIVTVVHALAFAPRAVRMTIATLLVLFVAPVILFANLHVEHEYYQTATTVFLIAALAVAIFNIRPSQTIIASIAALLLCACNVVQFYVAYLPTVNRSTDAFSSDPHTHLDVARFLHRQTPTRSAIVVFGADWNSTIPYYAERKAFMVPTWPQKPEWSATYDRVWQDPSAFVGELPLGALVYCDGWSRPNLGDIMERPEIRQGSPLYKIGACRIWLGTHSGVLTDQGKVINREVLYETLSSALPTQSEGAVSCQGSIDLIRNLGPDGVSLSGHVLTVAGWLVANGEDGLATDATYVTLRDALGNNLFVTTRPSPRPDVARHFNRSFQHDVGFSASFLIDQLHGVFQVGIARIVNGKLGLCDNHYKSIAIR